MPPRRPLARRLRDSSAIWVALAAPSLDDPVLPAFGYEEQGQLARFCSQAIAWIKVPAP